MAFEIDQEQCAACGVCVDSCKQGAIIEEGDKYKIIPEKCTDCGDCAEVCPVSCINGEKK